jgi:hypothetical protein
MAGDERAAVRQRPWPLPGWARLSQVAKSEVFAVAKTSKTKLPLVIVALLLVVHLDHAVRLGAGGRETATQPLYRPPDAPSADGWSSPRAATTAGLTARSLSPRAAPRSHVRFGDKGRVRVGRLRFASDDRFSCRRARGGRTPRRPHRSPARSMRERSGYRRAPDSGPVLTPPLHCCRCHAAHRRG